MLRLLCICEKGTERSLIVAFDTDTFKRVELDASHVGETFLYSTVDIESHPSRQIHAKIESIDVETKEITLTVTY